ncbi:GATA zinc finger domain-containing protein 1 [Taenia crassiceps]|uniref:GATA zinc finger domain-containing protein 1 n=1 Tax=Taenia crassiceps TaxID=6207 RepID=A0ABR4QPX2_9CEST
MSSDKVVAAFGSHTSERACRRKRTVKTDSDFDFTGTMKKALRSRGVTNKTKSSNGSSGSKCKSRSPPNLLHHGPLSALNHGKWLQIGDIVSVTDVEGGEYYAQVRSVIVDNSGDASVVLTWLVPTSEARRGEFDPSKYVIDCVSFLCHCPSDYFRPTDSPYTLQSWYPRVTPPTK